MRLLISISPSRERSSLGFGLGVLFAHCGARPLNEELIGVGSDFMHGNVEVAENAHDRLNGVFVEKRVRNVVVDFAVGDVAALLAEADELEEARAAHLLRVGLVGAVAVRHRFAQRAFPRGAALAGLARLARRLRGFGLHLFDGLLRGRLKLGDVLLVLGELVLGIVLDVAHDGVLVVDGVGLLRAAAGLLRRRLLRRGGLLRTRLALGLRFSIGSGLGRRRLGRGRFFGRRGRRRLRRRAAPRLRLRRVFGLRRFKRLGLSGFGRRGGRLLRRPPSRLRSRLFGVLGGNCGIVRAGLGLLRRALFRLGGRGSFQVDLQFHDGRRLLLAAARRLFRRFRFFNLRRFGCVFRGLFCRLARSCHTAAPCPSLFLSSSPRGPPRGFRAPPIRRRSNRARRPRKARGEEMPKPERLRNGRRPSNFATALSIQMAAFLKTPQFCKIRWVFI